MDLRHTLQRCISAIAAAVLLATSLFVPAQAAMIGTETLVRAEQNAGQRAQLQAFLAREDVRGQLEQWGVDPAEAQSRVDQLTDAEVAELAARMDEMPAGGADILGALVFVFVLLLITDILGFTDVFPFTRSVQ